MPFHCTQTPHLVQSHVSRSDASALLTSLCGSKPREWHYMIKRRLKEPSSGKQAKLCFASKLANS
eukprot:6438942-Amphidinium_carterae.2